MGSRVKSIQFSGNRSGSRPVKLPRTFDEIVDEIVMFTDLPRAEVTHRVWMQALVPGWNVLRDVARYNVIPYHYDEKMLQLYRESDAFIFETLVFWPKPHRNPWCQSMLDRIRHHTAQSATGPEATRILMFGDGSGNDSLYLAGHGLTIDYYDVPGSKTADFALKRFDTHGFLGRRINPISDYKQCLHGQYDVVVSFEVLEHLPEPLQAIKDIRSMLKLGGIALITEDFGDLAEHLPTHLKSSGRYKGKTPFLFLKHGMVLSWYGREHLFKPYEFTKCQKTSFVDLLRLWRDDNVSSAYLSRYSNMPARLLRRFAHLAAKYG